MDQIWKALSIATVGSMILFLSCNDPATPAQGPVAQNGGVVVISPNGGESLRIGDTVNVQFGYVCAESEIEGYDFVTELYFDDRQIIQSLDCCSQIELINEKQRPWVIPDSIWELNEDGSFGDRMIPLPRGSTYKIRIREYSELFRKDDYSDGYFTITD